MHVLPVAVSHKDGVASFNVAARGRSANALAEVSGSTQMGGVREVELVPTLTLDRLLDSQRPPDVLKIDVETAELLVLAGARRVLSEHAPAIYCEVTHSTRDEVMRQLLDLNYHLYDGESLTGTPRPVDSRVVNLVALPPHQSAWK